MPASMNLSGQDYHDWHVLRYLGRHKGRAMYLCRCKCGVEKEVSHGNLRSHKSKRCKKCAEALMRQANTKHGMSDPRDPTYRAWVNAKIIGRVPEWDDYVAFLRDMGHRPEGHGLRRRDWTFPHSKANTYWAPCAAGQSIAPLGRQLTANGITDNIAGWAKRCGVSRQCMHQRVERARGKYAKHTLEQALLAPRGLNPARYVVPAANG